MLEAQMPKFEWIMFCDENLGETLSNVAKKKFLKDHIFYSIIFLIND